MRKSKNKSFLVMQLSANFISFFVAGLVLLVTAAVLLINLKEFEAVVPQYLTIFWIFLIVFAVLGLALLLVGVFIAILSLSTAKNIEIEEEYILAPPQSTGLNIVRPSAGKKIAEQPVQKPTISKKKVADQVPIKTEAKKEPVKAAKKPAKADEAIPTDFTYEDALQSIVDRYNTEKVKKAFKGWYNTMMMTFPDLDKSFLYVINGDEGLDFSEGVDDEAAVKVKMESEIFVKMITKQINPIKAYSGGLLEVGGEMKNMLKLRKLMF